MLPAFAARWFGRGVNLPEPLRLRRQAWRALPATPMETPLHQLRCVVADTETSGLNPAGGHLLSIGAVALTGLRVDLADGFDAVLGQTQPSTRDNILVHGIGASEQRAGEAPPLALMRFLEFTGTAPLIGFHTRFDAAFVQRAMRAQLGFDAGLHWLDLAAVLPVLFEASPTLALDDWLLRFGIEPVARHSALGDALATAQLAQIALQKAASRGLIHFAALQKLAVDARWLPH